MTDEESTQSQGTGDRTAADRSEATSPAEVQDKEDPGDDVARRFRYQDAYGVILLVGSVAGDLEYTHIFCEHHEDLLAALPGDRFDAYQIKTRNPERGPWKLGDEKLRKSLARFVDLRSRFPNHLGAFKFVSNAKFLDSDRAPEKSPVRVAHAARAADSLEDLEEPFAPAIRALAQKLSADKTEVDPDELFNVLAHTEFIDGPSLEEFESVLSHDHLSRLPELSTAGASELNGIRDELIQQVRQASSLAVSDPRRHWTPRSDDADDPYILSKRVTLEDVRQTVASGSGTVFRFAPLSDRIRPRDAEQDLSRFELKLNRAGLGSSLETMRRRTVAAESHLLALGHAKPEDVDAVISQLESIVQGVCDDARLEASAGDRTFGPTMLLLVTQRLRTTARDNPQLVHHSPYECLMGVAGLLTNECKVWWSEHFDIAEAS